MLQKDIFRLQITVNNTQSKQSIETLQDGVGHLADKRCTETAEVAAFQQVIKIDAQQFEGDANMSSKDKVFQHVNDVQLVFSILLSHNMI